MQRWSKAIEGIRFRCNATRLARQKTTDLLQELLTKLSNRTETVALSNMNGCINRDTLRAKTVVSMPLFGVYGKRKV